MLDNWILCQNLWIYLKNVFVLDDVQKHVPDDAQCFNTVEETWQTLMIKARVSYRKLVEFSKLPNIVTEFQSAIQSMDGINRNLDVRINFH